MHLALQKIKKWSLKVENTKEPNLVFGKFDMNFFQQEQNVSVDILKKFDSEMKNIYDSLAPSTSNRNYHI